MKNMDEYYASPVASTDFLMHYGVKGMKWGVRKALERGDVKALRRHQIKALKKLAKLNKMAVSGKKYAAKAAAYGTGAALAGGLSGLGTGKISSLLLNRAAHLGKMSDQALATGSLIDKIRGNRLYERQKAYADAANAVKNFGESRSIAGKAIDKVGHLSPELNRYLNSTPGISEEQRKEIIKKYTDELKGRAPTNDAVVRVGLGAAALGLGAAAARNAYKAKHGDKYRRKAQEFERAMNETFGSIDYSKLQPRKKRRQ